MSKITQEKKEAKLKGKQAKIAKANAKKAVAENAETETVKTGSCKNYGKCCTCQFYPVHKHGEAQPCKVLKTYVARKAEHPDCYKCKF